MEKHAWPWDKSLDATIAAPNSHKVLLENDQTRVVEVVILAGHREPAHTHEWPSVMIVDQLRLFTTTQMEKAQNTLQEMSRAENPLSSGWNPKNSTLLRTLRIDHTTPSELNLKVSIIIFSRPIDAF